MSPSRDTDATRPVRLLVVAETPDVADDLFERLIRLGMTPAVVASADAAISRAFRTQPDVILMDVPMKAPLDTIDLAVEIRRRFRIPIVFLTAKSDESTIDRVKERGDYLYLSKPFHERELKGVIEKAIERACAERGFGVDRGRAAKHDVSHALAAANARYEALTSREREVLALVVRGRLNKQIAADLQITERTVKAHRARVMKKMNVGSLAELVRLAERLGM